VEAYFVLDDEQAADGQRVIPANAWVVDQQTGQLLAANRWLFTGSHFMTWEGEQLYGADLNGTVVSLVHFGDDLLARADTNQTDQSDNQQWNAAEGVPGAGEAVRLRLVVVKVDPAGDD
jgi:hypothetical protein